MALEIKTNPKAKKKKKVKKKIFFLIQIYSFFNLQFLISG